MQLTLGWPSPFQLFYLRWVLQVHALTEHPSVQYSSHHPFEFACSAHFHINHYMVSPLPEQTVAVADIRTVDYVARVSIVNFVLIKLRVLPSRHHHGCRV